MNLYLVRHTAADIARGICYGRSDIALPADYVTDFAVVAKRLERIVERDNLAVFSSPLQRCRQLAEFLFPERDVQLDARLVEMNFGHWELKPWDEIPRFELERWAKDVVNYAPPDGESYSELYGRCQAFIEEHLVGPMTDCCIVTHGGVIRAILAFFLQNAQAVPEHSGGLLSALLAESIECGALCHIELGADAHEVRYTISN